VLCWLVRQLCAGNTRRLNPSSNWPPRGPHRPCPGPADEVQRQGGKVLVHCMSGMSRSPAVVIYYLMRRNSWRLRWAVVAGHGWVAACVSPASSAAVCALDPPSAPLDACFPQPLPGTVLQ
jgi:hypothetical protein